MSASRAGSIDNRYRLIETLGQGGMGRVWRGYDEMLHRDVAVKEIVQQPAFDDAERRTIRERSLREARAIARLDHVNVVRIFDIVIAGGDPWIVMEYIPSESLHALLARDGRMAPSRVAEVGLAVLSALQAAHRAGVLHRDVKPANILLGQDGRIVLTDFGLATGTDDPRLTHTGTFMGTPSYFAPERLQDGIVGPAADLWSLGITLFAAVEGRTPYLRGTSFSTLNAVLTEPPPAVEHAGPLAPAIEGLLRKDPAERIDAETARTLLRAALDGEVPQKQESTSPQEQSVEVPQEQESVGRHAEALPGRPAFLDREISIDRAGSGGFSFTGGSSGRHRLPRRRFGVKSAAAVATLIVLVGAGWAKSSFGSGSACSGHETLRIAAAPEIAPVVLSVAQSWSGARKGGTCVEVSVVAADPVDTAEVVAAQGHTVVNGLGPPSGALARPDVWVPDSSTWLQRVRAVGADLVPAVGRSVARSPVVLAVPQPLAGQLGPPGATVTWPAVLQKMTTGAGLRAGLVDPARDAASLSALTRLADGAQSQTARVAAIRSLAANRSSVRADLLARFPRATDQTALGTGLAAAPLSEQAVISYNAAQPPVPLVPLFVSPQPAVLDYPYAVLPWAQAGTTDLADELFTHLRGSQFEAALAQHGLRNADGSTGPGFASTAGGPATLAAPVPLDLALVERTLSTWGVVTQPGRLLAVIDVSGSMKASVPTAGGKSREQVTVEAAATGLGLIGDDWSVGLWTFSTKLTGDIPYRQLEPIGLLATQRPALSAALTTVVPSGGGTGLYDTILAAYQAVQAGWDSSKSNSVVVLTDGQNDNPGGLTLDQLTAKLRQIADPQRRIQVIGVGIGEASRAELTTVTNVTGGGVFIAPDPSKIADIFLQAIALRTG